MRTIKERNKGFDMTKKLNNMEKPKKYKAKDLQGNWVTGWYSNKE